MDIFDNSQPFGGLAPLEKISSDQEQSDSEDEQGLSSLADYDTYENMNIPENLKNMLRLDSYDNAGGQSDTESDTDSIYKAPRVNIEELNAELASKNKFTNFPLMPPSADEPTQSKKKLTKPREKKKKRDKGKKVDILDQAQKAKTRDINDLFKSFNQDQSEEEEGEDREQVKSRKKGGRKTRKQKENNEIKVDENGERLIRTTEFLDDDSDSDSNDNHRALSKKQLLEMQRDADRNRRATEVKLTPVYNVKSFEDFVKKRDERESILLSQHEVSSKPKRQQLPPPPTTTENDSSDDDLIIVNDPTKLLSPVRPMSHLSPSRPTVAFRNHNKSLLSRITNEGYAYRLKMEQAAKERGQYTSATERAKKLLEKEKNALLIDAQIKMHFERNKSTLNDEEDDEDYKEEEEEEEEDYLNQLSGQEEEEEGINKRKIDLEEQEDEEEEEEGDMGVMAMRRWKNKKIRKSIFEDSDDEDEKVIPKNKPAPVPAHSISNFFKAKETKVEEEPIEDKPLGRLKRRIIQPDNEEEEEEEEEGASDAMDIDEPDMTPKRYTPTRIPGPKEKNEYFEEEAEEEDDEFFGAGGEDIDNGEDLDEYEEDDLLVHENNEHIDEAALREAFK
ncbi:hypothetical protein BD770DRAFT_220529 [Pilaira anomala]|nr:hypothetical protein BD770DRAFT_220529 [Pilaira anomala]